MIKEILYYHNRQPVLRNISLRHHHPTLSVLPRVDSHPYILKSFVICITIILKSSEVYIIELRIFDPRFGYPTWPDLKFCKNCYLREYRSDRNDFTIIGFVLIRRI